MSGSCEIYFQQELLRVVTLIEGENSIGRNHTNTIYLPHPSVSRAHGLISCVDSRLYYKDHSSFGSLVNGVHVWQAIAELKHADAIEIADFCIVYNGYSQRYDTTKTISALLRNEHSADRWKLVVEFPDQSQKTFELSDDNITIGPEPFHTVVLDAKKTDLHALTILTLKNGVYLYVDDNAVYIDGERATRGIYKFREQTRVTYCGVKVRLVREQSHQQDILIGSSPLMVEVRHNIELAATRLRHINVLIAGESGTGKELAARLIHDLSDRKSEKFIAVNCTSIPETLAESLLFGHCEGAFTDASKDHAGYFLSANNGTLFLDEIGDLPHAIQVKLLRAIEAQEIYPVGAAKSQKINVRVLSGTNRQINDGMVRAELGFRDDLYFRLAGFEIEMPALRHRKEDIAELIRHFHVELTHQEPATKKVAVSESVINLAHDYSWPGNVRELRHVIQKAILMADRVVSTLPISRQNILEMPDDDKYQSVLRMVREGAKNQDVMETFNIPRSTYFRIKKRVSKVSLK